MIWRKKGVSFITRYVRCSFVRFFSSLLSLFEIESKKSSSKVYISISFSLCHHKVNAYYIIFVLNAATNKQAERERVEKERPFHVYDPA